MFFHVVVNGKKFSVVVTFLLFCCGCSNVMFNFMHGISRSAGLPLTTV